MRLLHVISECPYPPNKGGRADVWARVQAMSELGFEMDMVIMSPTGQITPDAANHVRGQVRRLYVVEQLPTRRCACSIAPTRVSRNARLRELIVDRSYDLTLMEAEDTLPTLDNRSVDCGTTVLRIHNNESEYMAELARAEENFFRRQFFRIESMRLSAYRHAHFRRVDALWFISMKERDDFLAANPRFPGETEWLPPGLLHLPSSNRTARTSKAVLFVGSLDIPLNREAIGWYVAHVHQLLTPDPDYHLVVAGSTQERASALAFAAELREVPQCTIHIDVDDLDPLYADCALFINPMRRGGGVKLKTIHAVANGIPVVSTAVGIEGSGLIAGVHLMAADTPQGFAAAVSDCLSKPDAAADRACAASQLLQQRYDAKKNLQTLTTSLQSHAVSRVYRVKKPEPIRIRERQ